MYNIFIQVCNEQQLYTIYTIKVLLFVKEFKHFKKVLKITTKKPAL